MSERDRQPGRRRNRGAALIEFIIVMGLLFMMLFGIMEFGFMLSSSLTVNSAAQQGARAAALGKPMSDVQAAIYNALTIQKTAGPTTWTDTLWADNPVLSPTQWSYIVEYYSPSSGWQIVGSTTSLTSNNQIRVRVVYGYGYITGSTFGNMANLASGKTGTVTTRRNLKAQAVMRYGG